METHHVRFYHQLLLTLVYSVLILIGQCLAVCTVTAQLNNV